MTLAAAFAGVRSVLLDTSPTVYALERDPVWGTRSKAAVEFLFDAGIEVVATPITLSECVAGAPAGDVPTYVEFLVHSREVTFVPVDATVALLAGKLRQATGLKLPDCLQVATAVVRGCDLLLTNDLELSRRQQAIPTVTIADLQT